MTSFITYYSCSKVSSMTCVVMVASLFLLSCFAFFTLSCATTNSPITLSYLSYGTNRCWRIFCWSLIFSISMYDFLCAKMVAMHSTGSNVLMFSEAFYSFSRTSLNLASTTFISGSSIGFVQIYTLSSHNFVHSSRVLILATVVIEVLSLCAFSSSGVPSVVHNSKSSIIV
jgi:hypothetical protein